MKPRAQRRFEPFSDFELEAYLCDELPSAARSRIEHTLKRDAALASYIEERRRAKATFAARHPLKLDARPLPPVPRKLAFAFSVLSAAAVATLGLVVALQTQSSTPRERQDTVRVKGHAELRAQLSVKRGQQVWTYRPEQALRAGDQLMLSLDSDHSGYVTLLGRDAHGENAVYFDKLAAPAGRFVAPTSLTLDAETGEELWLVVWSPQPREAGEYFDELARGEPPDVPHVYFRLRKELP